MSKDRQSTHRPPFTDAKKTLAAAGLPNDAKDAGLVTGAAPAAMKAFVAAMKQHRVSDREDKTAEAPA